MRKLLLSLVLVPGAAALLAWAVTTQPFVSPIRSQPPAVDLARLRADVVHLSQTLHPRSFDHPEKLDAAGNYIQSAFRATGADVAEQELRVEGERYRNIVARFGPTSGPLLVIGAHYDSHASPGPGSDADSHTPGADDNASGVAGLLELARLLAKTPPPRPVELVAYTLEEPPHFRTGHMGSVHHAKALAAAGRPVSLMISLEMIGFFSDEPGSQRFPLPGMDLFYPDRGDFIAIVSRLQDWSPVRRLKAAMAGASDLPVFSINTLPAIPGVDFSDHRSYWHEDMPALMVTDTAFNRNRHYHGAGDTAERLDYPRMAKVVQGVYAFIQQP